MQLFKIHMASEDGPYVLCNDTWYERGDPEAVPTLFTEAEADACIKSMQQPFDPNVDFDHRYYKKVPA